LPVASAASKGSVVVPKNLRKKNFSARRRLARSAAERMTRLRALELSRLLNRSCAALFRIGRMGASKD
jgi:hypothetical protein